eukprot:4956543-Ditylum_brightwellii.AAC.1
MPPDEQSLMKNTASFETGWQRRSPGHNYSSMSGHGFLVYIDKKGTYKMVTFKGLLYFLKRKNLEVPEYECRINYEGNSNGMKVQMDFLSIRPTHQPSKRSASGSKDSLVSRR